MPRRTAICQLAIVVALLGFHAAHALAGQSSGNFRVGLTIVGAKAKTDRTPVRPVKVYTWNAAAISVRAVGYKKPVRLRSASGLYWFEAERKGSRYRVAVSVATGRIVAETTP